MFLSIVTLMVGGHNVPCNQNHKNNNIIHAYCVNAMTYVMTLMGDNHLARGHESLLHRASLATHTLVLSFDI